MADNPTESVNKVSLPLGDVGNKAPPTPPETQAGHDKTTNEPAPILPPVASEPLKSAEAPLAPAPTPAAGEPAPATEPAASSQTNGPPAPIVHDKIAEAEKLAAQPDKPSDNVPISSDDQPVNAESEAPVAALNGDAVLPPKPVSVEEVQDAEMPTVEPTSVKDAVKPSAAEDTVMTGALPSDAARTQDGPKTEPAPASSGPPEDAAKIGEKRKADVTGNVNGDVVEGSGTTTATEANGPAEKKQRTENGTEKGLGRSKSKKEKKAPAPVGKTARRTRSQAALDQE